MVAVVTFGDSDIMVRPVDGANLSAQLADHLRRNKFKFDEMHLEQGPL